MNLAYSELNSAFLSKITEYDFIQLADSTRIDIVDGYRKRAVSAFKKVCKYDLSLCDDTLQAYVADFEEDDIDEIVEIISDGMVLQWFKQFLYHQENLQNVMNTSDFSMYSPSELLHRTGAAYDRLKREYIQDVREYSYNHNDLTDLHM